jgi:hypothetical protein
MISVSFISILKLCMSGLTPETSDAPLLERLRSAVSLDLFDDLLC